jgi:hypothetical protein
MPWYSPSPERRPWISSCRISLSSPRSCSAAARIIGISESSISSNDKLGCREERDKCSRMKCRSREILSYAWLWQIQSLTIHRASSANQTSASATATTRRSASTLRLSANSRASATALSASTLCRDWNQSGKYESHGKRTSTAFLTSSNSFNTPSRDGRPFNNLL